MSRQSHPRPKAKIAARRCKLLCVEDHAETLALLEGLIAARRDLALLHAPRLDLATRIARDERPEVMLVNLELAGVPPRELIKRLRAETALQSVPILALGAEAGPGAVTQCIEAGLFLYLAKPLLAEPFIDALDYALEFVAVERSEES